MRETSVLHGKRTSSTGPALDGRGWALLVALALLWSASFIFIRIAAEDVPAFTLVLARVGLAALALHAVVLAGGKRFPSGKRIYAQYACMGLINNILPFALIVFATLRLGAGTASILNATAPLFALLVAHWATADEKITPAKLTGILLGVAGVAVMAGPQAAAGLGGDLVAVAAMLAACFFYGLSAIYGRRFNGIDATVSATCQLSAATLVLIPIAIIADRPWTLATPSAASIAAIAALALFSTALAYIIYYALIRRAGGTNTILVTLLIPPGGVALAWAYLGETLAPAEAAGMLLIGLGLAVIDGRAFARLMPAASLIRSGRGRCRSRAPPAT